MSLFTIADDLNHGEMYRLALAQQQFNPHYDIRGFLLQRPDPRSLDERFADFKRRLADAVERNERRKG